MSDLARMIETLRTGPDELSPDEAPRDEAPRDEAPLRELPLRDLPLGEPRAEYRGAGGQWDGYDADPLYPGRETHRGYHSGDGAVDFTGARTGAHYVPDASWSGYDPETGTTAPVSAGGNSTALPYSGSHGRPPESFPYGPAEGYEAIASHRGGPDLPLH